MDGNLIAERPMNRVIAVMTILMMIVMMKMLKCQCHMDAMKVKMSSQLTLILRVRNFLLH